MPFINSNHSGARGPYQHDLVTVTSYYVDHALRGYQEKIIIMHVRNLYKQASECHML